MLTKGWTLQKGGVSTELPPSCCDIQGFQTSCYANLPFGLSALTCLTRKVRLHDEQGGHELPAVGGEPPGTGGLQQRGRHHHRQLSLPLAGQGPVTGINIT